MIGLAARRDEVRILDSENRLLEADKLVWLPAQQSPKGRKLYGFLLKRAVRKEQGHGAHLLKRVD